MSTMRECTSETDRELFGFKNMTVAGLAINAASAATFKTAQALSYLNDGIWKSKAALAAQVFSNGHAVQLIGVTGYYTVAVDGAGNVATTQGFGNVPDVPNGFTPIGLIKVVNVSLGNPAATPPTGFTPNTTALDAAGIATTYFDVSLLPVANP